MTKEEEIRYWKKQAEKAKDLYETCECYRRAAALGDAEAKTQVDRLIRIHELTL